MPKNPISEANQIINRRIALRLGWSVETKIEPTFQGGDTMKTRALYDPSGELIYFHPFREATVEQCWSNAPQYSEDANLVLDALPEEYDILILRLVGGGYSGNIQHDMPGTALKRWKEYGATRSEAFAKAFLTLLDSQVVYKENQNGN